MRKIWMYIESKAWKAERKYKTALLILGTLFALMGCAVWLIVRQWILSTWDWMVCFIGYPIVLSWFVFFFYSCRYEFHDGRPVEDSITNSSITM